MYIKYLKKKLIYPIILILLINISAGVAGVKGSVKRRSCWDPERSLCAALGLNENVSNDEIVKLLDGRNKRILVMSLIRRRKISSASDKLLQIINDNNAMFLEKLYASKALCDFGNKDWVKRIKEIYSDPNNNIHISIRIDVAGLLARVGDYSQFDVVAEHIRDKDFSIRYFAIKALPNFQHMKKSNSVSAAELLMTVAISDQIPWLREHAIFCLEKMAKDQPEIKAVVVDALEINLNSPDNNLRIICEAKLRSYRKN